MKIFLIIVWRVYQIFLISLLSVTWIYDIISLSNGSDSLAFVFLDAIFLGKLNCFFLIGVVDRLWHGMWFLEKCDLISVKLLRKLIEKLKFASFWILLSTFHDIICDSLSWKCIRKKFWGIHFHEMRQQCQTHLIATSYFPCKRKTDKLSAYERLDASHPNIFKPISSFLSRI